MPAHENNTNETQPLLFSNSDDHGDHSVGSDEDAGIFDSPFGESHRHGFSPRNFLHVTWRSSCTASKYVNILWPFVLLAIIVKLVVPDKGLWVFGLSYVAMIPAANLVGFAGQELARKMRNKVAGVLVETTAGGVVEVVLFLVLVSEHRGGGEEGGEGNLVPVIQAAILGSILTNLLLCLGLCFFFGGLREATQDFHAAVSEVGNGILLVAGFGLLIPSVFYSALKGETQPSLVQSVRGVVVQTARFTREQLMKDVQRISLATSVILIVSFVVYIWFNARSQHSIFDEVLEADEHRDADIEQDMAKSKYTGTECTVALVVSLTLVTLFAFFLVGEIEELVKAGVPDAFLGLIMLPLVEKAAEHLTAIDEAWDGQMNFALYHCLGPSVQTALLNGPLTVVFAWAVGKRDMDLNFEIFQIVLLLLAIIVIGQFLRDGQSNYLEGFLLVTVYVIIAIASWNYPDPDVATSNGLENFVLGGH